MRPIAELEAEFAQDRRSTPDGRAWAELTRSEQRRITDSHRLVYQSDAPVNWCPGLGTVVANEEVTAEGRSDRGNFPVFRKKSDRGPRPPGQRGSVGRPVAQT